MNKKNITEFTFEEAYEGRVRVRGRERVNIERRERNGIQRGQRLAGFGCRCHVRT